MTQKLIHNGRGQNRSATGFSSTISPSETDKRPAWKKISDAFLSFHTFLSPTDWSSDYLRYSKILRENPIFANIFKEISVANDLENAIKELKEQKCVIGLVAIAMVRKDDVRELAIRALANSDSPHQITEYTNAICRAVSSELVHGENYNYFVTGGDKKIYLTAIHKFPPKLLMEIALEENSPSLGEYAFNRCLHDLGPEKTKPLFDFLVASNHWNAIESEITRVNLESRKRVAPDSWVIELGPHVDAIAKSRTRYILPIIAAIHPDKEVRMLALNAINGGGCDAPYNVRYSLEYAAKQSKFEDTGKYAVDLIANRVDFSQPVYGCNLMDAIGFGIPSVAKYAFDKLTGIWDKSTGYGYPYQWDMLSQEFKQMLLAYFEKNLDNLFSANEGDALGWMLDRYMNNRPSQAMSNNPGKIAKYLFGKLDSIRSFPILKALSSYYSKIGDQKKVDAILARDEILTKEQTDEAINNR